jgi:hypothetical protein
MGLVTMADISQNELDQLRKIIHPLIGLQIELLKIPAPILAAFEPSQIGTIVGTLMDACIPQLELIIPGNSLLSKIGFKKAPVQ